MSTERVKIILEGMGISPRSTFVCRNCGTEVIQGTLPGVEVPNEPEREYCYECLIKMGKLKSMEVVEEIDG